MEFPNTTDDLDDLTGIELTGHDSAVQRDGNVRYLLEKRLGGGGQGNAFLATRYGDLPGDVGPVTSRTPVVVKIWRPSFVLAHAEIATLVLKKEYVALARLNDRLPPTPFVVRLLDGGEITVRMRFASVVLPWLAIEYVHGGALGTTLSERVHECVTTAGVGLSPARLRRVFSAIVQGLLAIHEVGVVHRDLKPTNVLLCGVGDDELAKVADFGLARPMGMASTFGNLAVGTPGYAAPEQMDAAKVGPWSDVFSLAALTYFAIAGEDMFEGSPTVKMANVYAGNCTSLLSRSRVDPAWKAANALARVDTVLRRATQRELRARIPGIAEFWAAIEPALGDAESQGRASAVAGSARTLQDAVFSPWSFHVAHRAPEPLRLRTVAFDPDGHGLGAGETGLWYWEGTRWIKLPAPQGLNPRAIRFLRRLRPSRWIACGDGGLLHVFTPTRCEIEQRVADPEFAVTTASVRSERYFALAMAAPGSRPRVIACLDGVWTEPVDVPFAQTVTALAPASIGVWYLTGADHAGAGVFALYDAAQGLLHRWPIESAALLAAASDGAGVSYAVGKGGFAFRKKEGHPQLERVLSHRDLTVIAIDPANGVWAAGVGRILHRAPTTTADWLPLWSSPEWTSRFVSIAALSGMVMAASEDGAIVVGHQGLTGSNPYSHSIPAEPSMG